MHIVSDHLAGPGPGDGSADRDSIHGRIRREVLLAGEKAGAEPDGGERGWGARFFPPERHRHEAADGRAVAELSLTVATPAVAGVVRDYPARIGRATRNLTEGQP